MIDLKDEVNKVIEEVKSIRRDLDKLSTIIPSRRLQNCIPIVYETLNSVRTRIDDIILRVSRLPTIYVERWLVIKQLNVVVSHIDLVISYAKVIMSQVERHIISEYRLKREEDYIVRHINYIMEALEEVLKNLSNILLSLK